jgi:hypothetical protein
MDGEGVKKRRPLAQLQGLRRSVERSRTSRAFFINLLNNRDIRAACRRGRRAGI